MLFLLLCGLGGVLALVSRQERLGGVSCCVLPVQTHFDKIAVRVIDVCEREQLHVGVPLVVASPTDEIAIVQKCIRVSQK